MSWTPGARYFTVVKGLFAVARAVDTDFEMNVWLIQPAEPMLVDAGDNRLWRTGYTASLLAQQGHNVVWWASNFSHAQKRFRMADGDRAQPAPNYTIRFIPALGYRRNVSWARIKDHRYVAARFAGIAPHEPPPDVILASFPTIEMCAEAIDYAKPRGIPVVVDVRDQWPDLFYETAPAPARPLVKLLCRGIEAQANYVFREATAVTGNAVQAMEWGLRRGGRERTELDRAFPMGYAAPEFAPEDREAAVRFWKDRGLDADGSRFVAVYGGAVGKTGDFDTIIQTARTLGDFLFVIAGVGDELERLKAAAAGLENVWFTGWLGAAEMSVLLDLATVGLVPYKDSPNFEGGITNKPVEYLAHGLPVVTTLRRGELHNLLDARGCGFFYQAGRSEELTETLRGLASNPTARQAAAMRARAAYEDEFKAEKVYGEMIEHLWKVHAATHARKAGGPIES